MCLLFPNQRMFYVECAGRRVRATPVNTFPAHRWSCARSKLDGLSSLLATIYTVMLWAACCPGFFGFLRAGAFTVSSLSAFEPASHLTPQDITTDFHENPTIAFMNLKQPKTDPFRRSADVHLARSANDICSVLSLLVYMALRGSSSGRLFIFRGRFTLSSIKVVQ